MKRMLAFLLVLTALLAGCGGESGQTPAPDPAPAGPAAPTGPIADPGRAGAQAALEAYAEARRALDFARAYDLLTPTAQAAATLTEFTEIYHGQKAFSFSSVEVEEPKDGLARGFVTRLAIARDRTYRYERYPYTLRYEQGRWGVAHGAGFGPKALRAFDTGKFDENLAVTDQWTALDPFAWEPWLERFYVFKDTGRGAEAREAWDRALELAPPEERPELYRILAMLYTLNKEGEPLRRAAEQALAEANKLGREHGERYDYRWRAAALIDLAFAWRFLGDETQAYRHYEEALALDPENKQVERFERTTPAP